MFAVPGWSVSADVLRTQTGLNALQAATVHKPDHPISTDKKKSRKRKRENGASNAVEVTDENLGDLWRRHIEEQSLDQPQPKEKGKSGKQSNEGKDDTLGETENVNGGSFEGFSGEDQTAGLIEEGPPPKKRKGKGKEDNSAGTFQVNGHEDGAETASPLLKKQGEVEDGKLKYEQRKAKALKKREERASLQANGTLPPNHPGNISNHPTKDKPASPSQTAKPSKSSQATGDLREPTTTEPRKVSRAPEPPEPSRAADTTQTSTPSLPSTKLTPLQQRMAAKLTSARFRHLNQTLYTSPSDHAMRLFTDSPQNYTSYHAGFRAQVAVWPQNPVEGFINDIKARATVSVPSQKKLWREQKKGGKKKQPKDGNTDTVVGPTTTTTQAGEKLDPLPRSPPNNICTIADLGCGDATLAGTLSPSAKSLGLKFLSYDLAKGDTPHAHLVSVADIGNLSAVGVRDETVDVAICCLSLMGTNWVDIVGECARVVRAGGEVWVAEIKSRFARVGVDKKTKKEAEEGGIGRKKKGAGKGKGVVGEVEEGDDEAAVLEEMDDVVIKGGKKDETDVGDFVEVFRKRGMVLKGQPDMANKMFVKMRFVKKGLGAATAARTEKGGGEKNGGGRGDEKGGRRSGMFNKKKKFLDEDRDGVVERDGDESKVLKPCVYKTR